MFTFVNNREWDHTNILDLRTFAHFNDHKVPNIVVNNQVPWDGWNHLDFLYAIDIDQYQNDDLLAALAMYPID